MLSVEVLTVDASSPGDLATFWEAALGWRRNFCAPPVKSYGACVYGHAKHRAAGKNHKHGRVIRNSGENSPVAQIPQRRWNAKHNQRTHDKSE